MTGSAVRMSGDESFASNSSHDETTAFGNIVKEEGDVCSGCGVVIVDRYLLNVNGRAWHLDCLRCCVCRDGLERQSSCFVRDDNVYCKLDYAREFGKRCSKCLRGIEKADWVRRAKDDVYHLACFACDNCKRQLSTGEEFALQDHKVLCRTHYIEVIEGPANDDDGWPYSADESSSGGSKHKAKRVRTTFTEEQLQVLQANFQLDSNPDGQDLERIAQITGLSKRVTQVWFQNSRARQKKHQQGPSSHHHHHHQHHHQQLGEHASPLNGHRASLGSVGGSPSPDANMYQSGQFAEYDFDVVSP